MDTSNAMIFVSNFVLYVKYQSIVSQSCLCFSQNSIALLAYLLLKEIVIFSLPELAVRAFPIKVALCLPLLKGFKLLQYNYATAKKKNKHYILEVKIYWVFICQGKKLRNLNEIKSIKCSENIALKTAMHS